MARRGFARILAGEGVPGYGSSPQHPNTIALIMNRFSRRKLLAAGGLAAASVAAGLGSSNANAAEAQPPDKPGQKFKIVVAGGHPGDPEYGCGGAIARFTDRGHEVALLYLNHGDPAEILSENRPMPRVAEAAKACEILKARPLFAGQIDGNAVVDAAHYDAFRRIIAAEKPDAVFTHWPIDNHADHRAMSILVYDAWRHLKKSFALFYYEVSSGEDTVQFAPTVYLDITGTEPRKRLACFAHASQSPDRYYNLQDMVARMRGAESGHARAEAFVRHIQSPEFSLP
jgi:LmbE family N-acetylglucosaminyl deacetylase